MSGLGKDMSGMVGISRDEVGAGIFPDTNPVGNAEIKLQQLTMASKS